MNYQTMTEEEQLEAAIQASLDSEEESKIANEVNDAMLAAVLEESKHDESEMRFQNNMAKAMKQSEEESKRLFQEEQQFESILKQSETAYEMERCFAIKEKSDLEQAIRNSLNESKQPTLEICKQENKFLKDVPDVVCSCMHGLINYNDGNQHVAKLPNFWILMESCQGKSHVMLRHFYTNEVIVTSPSNLVKINVK